MKRYLAVLRGPLFLVAINFFLVNTLFSLLPVSTGNIAYNLGRIAIVFYGGWLIVSRKAGSIRHAAAAGAVIYFADHVLVKGGVFLLNFLFKPQGSGLTAFVHVLISFILLVPFAMLIGAAGGFIASARARQNMPGA